MPLAQINWFSWSENWRRQRRDRIILVFVLVPAVSQCFFDIIHNRTNFKCEYLNNTLFYDIYMYFGCTHLFNHRIIPNQCPHGDVILAVYGVTTFISISACLLTTTANKSNHNDEFWHPSFITMSSHHRIKVWIADYSPMSINF